MAFGFFRHIVSYFTSDSTPSLVKVENNPPTHRNTISIEPLYDDKGVQRGWVQVPISQSAHTVLTTDTGASSMNAVLSGLSGVPSSSNLPSYALKQPLTHDSGFRGEVTKTDNNNHPIKGAENSTTVRHVLEPQTAKTVEWDGWPDGDLEQNFTNDEYLETKNILVHWAHSVSGGGRVKTCTEQELREHPYLAGKKTRRQCKGMIQCNNPRCNIIIRPQIRMDGILKQLQKPCQCGAELAHYRCPVVSSVWHWDEGYYYVNGGYHNHPKLSHTLHLTKKEEAEFARIVTSNARTGPLGLIVGVPTAYGVGESVADISDILLNSDRVKKERQKVLHGESTADTFLTEFAQFTLDYPGFVLHSQIGDVTVISMQTEFMRSHLIRQMVDRDAVNGLVTDAAHGFWKSTKALLLITSLYSEHLLRWMPALMSYTNGASAAHYQIHFIALFEGIIKECISQDIALDDKWFVNVVDFSEAQRLGFIEAIVYTWRSVYPDRRDITDDQLRKEAHNLLKGCKQHFWASITRMTKMHAVISPDKKSVFESLVHVLQSTVTKDSFFETAALICSQFPQAESWLAWWMEDEHASMLFASHQKMDTDIYNSIPDTTNAEEAMHWKLYSALGRDHTLLEGLNALYSFASYYKRLYDASMKGTLIQYGKAEPWKMTASAIGRTKRSRAPESYSRKKSKNDGRPPDTVKELIPESDKQQKLDKMDIDQAIYNISSPSYIWRNNSCWLDSSLELVFQGLCYDFSVVKTISQNMPNSNLFRAVIDHMQKRFDLLTSDITRDKRKVSTELTQMREDIRQLLVNQKLVPSMTAFGAPFLWVQGLASVESAQHISALSIFQGFKLRIRYCSGEQANTHYSIPAKPFEKYVQLDITNTVDPAQYSYKIANWLKAQTDVNNMPRSIGCWRNYESVVRCEGNATEVVFILSIPQILIIELAVDASDKYRWDFPEVLLPSDKHSAKKYGLEYYLVGRIYHEEKKSHFISRYYNKSQSRVYQYDRMKRHGNAIPTGSASSSASLTGSKHKSPDGCVTHSVVYHLKGGSIAQQRFLELQIEKAKRVHRLAFEPDHQLMAGVLPEISMNRELYEPIARDDRWWLKDPHSARWREVDYEIPHSISTNVSPSRSEPTQSKISKKQPGTDLGIELESSDSTPLPSPEKLFEISRTEKQLAQGDPKIQGASRLSDNHLNPFRCRCGMTGDCGTCQNDEPIILCISCSRWSHMACQKAGRASNLRPNEKFICDFCPGTHWFPKPPTRSLNQRTKSQKTTKAHSHHLTIGKGALARSGEFWYPVRLVQKSGLQWKVVWWRDNHYDILSDQPVWINEHDLIDDLWGDRIGRRNVRLGRWTHANEIPTSEDILSDPQALQYTAEIDIALRPHLDILNGLVKWKDVLDSQDEQQMTRYKDIPVVQYLRTNLVSPPAKKQDNDDNRIDTRMQHFLKQGNIPCYGNLSVTELGQIANWLDSYLLQGPKRRHLWLGRACQAHAATLLIAYRTRNMLQDQTDHSQDSEMPDQHILQTAWTIQMRFQSMDTEFIIDVDKECLALFEERLFEVSKHAGPAGDYQWGLDSGDHQDKWDPWGDIPSHWKDPNHDIDAEELEHGPNFIHIASPQPEPINRGKRIAPRSIQSSRNSKKRKLNK